MTYERHGVRMRQIFYDYIFGGIPFDSRVITFTSEEVAEIFGIMSDPFVYEPVDHWKYRGIPYKNKSMLLFTTSTSAVTAKP